MCISPLTINGKLVSCNRCRACRISSASSWIHRLLDESSVSTSDLVLFTLRYPDNEVPLTFKEPFVKSLRYSDVQKFIKRLRKRKRFSGSNIKYLCICNYDSDFNPFYYLLVFNLSLFDLQKVPFGSSKVPVYVSETINDLWFKHKSNVDITYVSDYSSLSFLYDFFITRPLGESKGLYPFVEKPSLKCSQRLSPKVVIKDFSL